MNGKDLQLIIFFFLTGQFVFRSVLSLVNIYHQKKKSNVIPDQWKQMINTAKLPESAAYNSINTKWGLIENTLSMILTLVFLYSGILPPYSMFFSGILDFHVLNGCLFILSIGAVSLLTGIPFSLVHHFYIEKKFNFSTITLKTWIADQIKSVLLGLALGIPIICGFLLIIEKTGTAWWIWAWLLFNGFQLFVSFIFPVLLAPVFYKFEPLKNLALNEKILNLCGKASFPVSGIFQIDASKRSTHSNAFFAGFGKTRRIALFDTLLNKHSDEEILAILGHEVGHWKKGHIIKGFLTGLLFSGVGLFVSAQLIDQPWLYEAFGLLDLYNETGVRGVVAAAGMILTGFLLMPASFLLEPATSYFSRKREYEADRFSVELFNHPDAMETALFKLNMENLSNLFPHPLYVIFHYSHPTLFQRVKALGDYRKKDNK